MFALALAVLQVGAPTASAEYIFINPGCSPVAANPVENTITITATGAAGAGGGGFDGNGPGSGGSGDTVSATVTGYSGPLYVCVDTGGGTGNTPDGYDFTGDGNGGGASGVSLGTDFSSPVVIAGGGGGGADVPENGASGAGGNAGYPSGGGGQSAGFGSGGGGGGGTQTGGGRGGNDDAGGGGTNSSGPGQGGNDRSNAGAGGGGGYYGGGAGYLGGGGGGSDFCTDGPSPDSTTVSSCAESTASGQAQVTISYSITKYDPTLSTAASTSGQGSSATISDSATISGGYEPGGSITFDAYYEGSIDGVPNECGPGAPPTLTSTVPVQGNGTYSSGDLAPPDPGTYDFVATYSPDRFNTAPAPDICGDPSETTVVTGGPSPPTNVMATPSSPPNPPTVGLTWTAPSFGADVLTGYNVYVGADGSFSGTPVNTTPIAGTSYTVTGLSPGQTYEFEVEAASPDGNATSAPPVSATVPGPPIVMGVQPTSGASTGLKAVTITGSNFTGAQSVTFGGVQATSFTIGSDTQITAVTPAHDVGTVDVQVLNAQGPSYVNQSDQYTFTPSYTGQLMIEALRFSGPGGAGDQYVQLFNPTTSPVSLTGWSLNFDEGHGSQTTVVDLPQGYVIPANGAFLVAGDQYSLDSLASPDQLLTASSTPANPDGVQLVAPDASIVDAVGFAGAPAAFASGSPLIPPATLPDEDYAWVRNFSDGSPVNTSNNLTDFSFIAEDDNDALHGSPVLGSPVPSDSGSPVVHNEILQSSLVDPSPDALPTTNVSYTKGSPGTLVVNRTLTNCSGEPTTGLDQAPNGVCLNAATPTPGETVTRLRFRITALTTLDSPGAAPTQAVLEPETSATTTVNGFTVDGLTLQAVQPPQAQSAEPGGLNSTLDATADLPNGGLAPGQSINVSFQFAVTQTGDYSFAYNAEDDLVPAPATAPTPPTVTSTTPAVGSSSGSSGAPGSGSPAAPLTAVVSGTVSPIGEVAASSPPVTAVSAAASPSKPKAKKAKAKAKTAKKKPRAGKHPKAGSHIKAGKTKKPAVRSARRGSGRPRRNGRGA